MPDHSIIVRDRRQVHQFSVHNRVIDEWLPIIGPTGYAIYSLYVRMANATDERSWPGYTLITTHLAIGRATLSDHNKLLLWCRLIHIEPGTTHTSNNYYILDIPTVTAELLHAVRLQAQALPLNSRFRHTITKRLDNWTSIQSLWNTRPKPQIFRPGQPLLPGCEPHQTSSPAEHPGSVPEHPSSVPEHPVRQENQNNPKQQSKLTQVEEITQLLTQTGITVDVAAGLAETCSRELVEGWIAYAATQELHNRAGFLITSLRSRQQPPTHIPQYTDTINR